MILNELFSPSLDEMAPSPEIKGMRLYHGTKTTAAAADIIKNGIRPGAVTQGRGQLAPVAGRSYFTPDIAYAQMYAIGGDIAGHKMPEQFMKGSRYGYVFVISGANLGDVNPDEDSVGEFLSKHAEEIMRPGTNGYPRPTGDYTFKPDGIDDYAKKIVWYNIKGLMTPKQFKDACFGLVAAQAAGGKRAVKLLNDGDKARLIRWGAHVAAEGSYMPDECWRIDKLKCHKLKRDGSNFFEIAQKMQRIRSTN
jgi:hypothetical protein